MDRRLSKHPITKQFGNGVSLDVNKGFGNDVEVIPVLTDSEYLAVHKELD